MKQSTKPIVGISKCLEFDNCRYDGKIIGNEFVRNMKDHVEFIPVCPEVGIGLGTPRKTVRLVKIKGQKSLYQPDTDSNLTEQMDKFSEEFLSSIKSIDGFILKHSSPTCGVRNTRLYHKIGKEVGYDQTSGIFTDAIIKKFPNMVIEDEARLRNEVIRDAFLTRIFTMSSLRKAIESDSYEALLDFSLRNQMLFMCYDQRKAKEITELIKNREIHELNDFNDKLKKSVYDILNDIPNYSSMLGSFNYIFSIIKERLHNSEKEHFDSLMMEFSRGLILYSEISTLLYSWALRFELENIQSQSIFRPYPKELSYNSKDKYRDYSLLKMR